MSKKVLIGAITFVAVIISIMLQMNFLNEFKLFGINANIAIVIICGIALMSGKMPGILIGTTYGIFFDILARKKFWSIYIIVRFAWNDC